ncbi:MAG: TIGR03621 family F420-dependent LLM class oxidoreductase [Acidimicrobiia bacterium]|nr:TIGR03621 family F420-dependent LLM class oxidoreductase [Acidimicrobiia bacterium]
MTIRPFRFGMNIDKPDPGLNWGDTARKLEDGGWSTLLMPDHFGDQLAVSPALAAAAQATSTLRVGSLVFGNDYRHPVVLAKEIATLDVLSGGRVEFGIGAGWMRTDYEKAGMAYDQPGVRIDKMLESLSIVRGLFAHGPVNFTGEHYTITGMEGFPKPVQSQLPILIGGGGKRMLGIAGREADIVGVIGSLRAGEVGPEVLADSTAERYDEKLGWLRDAAGDRFDDLELQLLVITTTVTDDWASAAEEVGSQFGLTAEATIDKPWLLVGSTGKIIETLQAHRERWGFSYIVLQDPAKIDAFAPVITALSGT